MALPECPIGVHCGGTDYPVSNFSSEAADGPTFLGLSWPGGGGGTPTTWDIPPSPTGDNPGGGGGGGIDPNPYPTLGGGPVVHPQPVLGSVWSSEGCFGTCLSSISQANADLCAAMQAELCVDPAVDTTDHVPDSYVNGDPVPRYYNHAKQCQWPCGDGTFNVFTVPAGTFISNSQEMADRMAYNYACFRAFGNRMCMNAVDENICVQMHTLIPVTLSVGFHPPFTFTLASGTLPAGMSLYNDSPTTAVIEGTPEAAGVYVFSIMVQDSVGQTLTKQGEISVMGVVQDALPTGKEDVTYNETVTATGGSGTYTFSATGLPPGLTMDSSGVISGIPETGSAGTYNVVVTVSDE